MTEPAARTRVLYVDDDPLARTAFARALEGRGYDVRLASSPQQAIQLASRECFPLVVSDLRMPSVMDGEALIRHLTPSCPTAAFVLMTGDRNVDLNRDRGLDDVLFSVLAKPWDVDELIETLERARALKRGALVERSDPLADAAHSRLLLVEDNPGDVFLIRDQLDLLAPGQQRLVAVSRLDDALQRLHDERFGYILTDLSLPDARGLDAVVRLRRAAPQTPVVVLTGLEDDEVALQALDAGAQEVVLKGALDGTCLQRVLRFAAQRKRSEARLNRLAHFDQLTGLLNRTSFHDRVQGALARGRRTGEAFGVMFLDLDHFKQINDTLGHDAGDQLLQEVAGRLRACLREYDAAARMGGDEFAVLVESPTDASLVKMLGERVLEALSAPIGVGLRDVIVTASVGGAVFPQAGGTVEELLRASDFAMYEAKRGGRNQVRVTARGPMSAPLEETVDLGPGEVDITALPSASTGPPSRSTR